ncbi:MAG: PAS domain S-box protein [Hyphomonadaceae bacterium]|nr:PAS domain S-box protein [Hyphomonadaceae bacterium]
MTDLAQAAKPVPTDMTGGLRAWEQTFHAAPIGIAHVGADGRWLRVNTHVCEMLGYTERELMEFTFQDLTHPDDVNTDVDLAGKVLSGDLERYKMQKRYFHKAGHTVWANLTVAAVRTNNGEFVHFVSVLEDISEFKRMHMALEESEARFRAVQETSPDGFMTFEAVRDKSGTICDLRWTYINAAAERIVGRSADDLNGKLLLEEMPGNREEGLFDAYVQVIETGQTWQNEFRYDHDGIKAHFHTTAARAGNGLAVSFADITALRHSEERLRRVLNNVVAFIGVLSLDGTLLVANEPALAAADLTREDVIGKPFWDCFWWNYSEESKNLIREAVRRAAEGETVRFDAEIRVANNVPMHIDFQLAPNYDDSGEIIDLIPSGVDITERKRAEKHREMLLQELSHRVKNTLATVQAMAGHTMRTSSDFESFQTAYRGRLQAIARCHELLVATNHTKVNLRSLIETQIRALTRDDGTSLEICGKPLVLGGEAAHAFGLVLHEMATNAAKYGALSTPKGKVHISWGDSLGDDGIKCIEIIWKESGGPPVMPPKKRGFGSLLIEQSLSHGLGGTTSISYAQSGLDARFRLPLSAAQ